MLLYADCIFICHQCGFISMCWYVFLCILIFTFFLFYSFYFHGILYGSCGLMQIKMMMNRKPYSIYLMVPLSMTLSDLWPGFQFHTNRKLYLTYGMVLCLVTFDWPWTRRVGLSASAELLVMFGLFGFKLPIHANFWVVLGDMTGETTTKFAWWLN